MREIENGLYELFLVKDPKLKLFQGIFNTCPDIREWSMSDLYSKHSDPAKPFLFRYQGRKDDVIVLSNGEKIAPALMETALMSHHLVKGAMIIGKGKFQPAVLVDLFTGPQEDAMDRYRLIESLRPAIREANKFAPAHGQLDEYDVLFADPKKPIAYLGQGKIQRIRTYALYEDDIEALYASVEDDSREQLRLHDSLSLDFMNKIHITQRLKFLLAKVARIEGLDEDQDLFAAGLDSLQVIRIAQELRLEAKVFGLTKADEVRPPAIYSHPTLQKLAAWLLHEGQTQPTTNGLDKYHMNGHNTGHGNPDQNGSGEESSKGATTSLMTRLLAEQVQSLPFLPPTRNTPKENVTVLLTGSTGSLGSYLLEALQHNSKVARIICLNRVSDAAVRHRKTCQERGLSQPDRRRVEFLRADLSKPELGLKDWVYAGLLKTVTHIIRTLPTSVFF